MAHQTLYRRYRPRRFSEVLGQDHVVRALVNVSTSATPAHAYLFSGPRGTGKTSTARILAKALNCEAPVDGEPCGICASCVALDAGTSVDVHEHDAASNRGIDQMRELVRSASLGTPGRYKVFILDEIHQVRPEAASVLLKAIEEPPSHVVWILATTDPQKVLPTIRSRTQHFDFHLLPPDLLEKHVRWVVDDASLTVDDDVVAHVVRAAKGSVRDALSILDQVAASGGVGAGSDLEPLIEAIAAGDPAAALAAVAAMVEAGRDPRWLTTELASEMRDVFLLVVAPDHASAVAHRDREPLIERAQQIGAAAAVRAVELLGEAVVAQRDAPDPRIVLEAVLVRLTSPTADTDVAALGARIEQLERRVHELSSRVGNATALAVADGPANQAPRPQRPGGRAAATLSPGAAAAREALDRARASASSAPTSPVPPPAPAAPPPSAVAESSVVGGELPSRDQLTLAWGDHILDRLSRRARARFAPGHFIGVVDGVAVIGLPNEPHRQRCEQDRPEVEQSLAAHFGVPVPIRLTVENDPSSTVTSSDDDDMVDTSELVDAPRADSPAALGTLVEVFPGAEVIDEAGDT